MTLVIWHDGTIFRTSTRIIYCCCCFLFNIYSVSKKFIYIYFLSESYKSNNYNIELDEIMYIDGNYT